MKVLYVVRYWPTLTETFVMREIEELRRRGHAVEVVAIGRRSDGELHDQIPLVKVQYPPKFPWRSWRLRSKAHWKVALRQGWLAELAKQGFDRIHAHFAGEAAEWARHAATAAGIPFSVTVHGVDLFKPRVDTAQVLRAADKVLAISAHHARWLHENYGISSVILRCGVPENVPVAAHRERKVRVVSVGRNVPKKGLDLLVRAAREFPDWEFRIVSDLPSSLGVTTGFLPPSQIPALLAESDLFVLPCRIAEDGDRDGIPVALMEAMAAGLPVISTTVSGIPELVDAAVGWCVPSDDFEALMAAMREAGVVRERARRGAAARARILEDRWTLSRQVDELLAAWG